MNFFLVQVTEQTPGSVTVAGADVSNAIVLDRRRKPRAGLRYHRFWRRGAYGADCRVAITSAYAILDMEDPIGAATALSAGFHEKYPLQSCELDLLFNLITMRLVTSVTISASRHDQTDDNPYLAISEAPAWRLLEKMHAMNPRLATAILRKACGFDAVEGAGAVRVWIAGNAANFADIVRPAPATMSKAIVPYGDASHEMTIASAAQRPGDSTRWWDDFAAENKITQASDLGARSAPSIPTPPSNPALSRVSVASTTWAWTFSCQPVRRSTRHSPQR